MKRGFIDTLPGSIATRAKGANPTRKLDICIVSLSCYPDVKDGAAFNIRGIFDGLRRRGHKVTMYTGLWNTDLQEPTIHQVKIPRKRFLWFPQFVGQVAQRLLKSNFDIIHGNGSRGSLPIILANKPFVTTIHDFGPFEATFTKFPIMPVLERLNANRATRIATVSNINVRGIAHYMGEKNAQKARVILSAIDPTLKPQPKLAEEIRNRLGLQGPTLFYVGRIAFYKGVEDIIKAFLILKKKIPNLNLVVGGKPELKMVDTVRQWKEKYTDVKFVGLIPNQELAAYYTLSDLFVTYSYASEGFGLTPIEALACGTPVVCSTLPAYREVLQDHAVFVPPKQPERLAATIDSIIKDEARRKQMVKDAQTLLELYSWKTVIDRIEGIYRELVT